MRALAGVACALAVLVPALGARAGAAGGAPQALNTIADIVAALRACWVPPPLSDAHPGMQITVRFSFTRDGAILGTPRFTYALHGVEPAVRAAYERAVAATLERCAPLPFSPGLGQALAGQPFAIRFVDNRTR